MSRAGRRVLRDELWTGRVALEGECVVEAGAVLFLAPGCRVVDASGGAARLLVKGLLAARGLPGLPVSLRARVVALGGRVDLARCRLRGDGSGDGLLLRGAGHRLRRVRVEGFDTGLTLRGGEASVQGLEFHDCRDAARVDEGGELAWRGGGASGGGAGLILDGGRARLSGLRFEGLRAGAHVNAGAAEIDGLACRALADEAVGLHGPGFVSARGLRHADGAALVVVDGHAHLLDAPAGSVRVSGAGRLCAAAPPELPMGAARRLVLASGAWAPAKALYRLAAAGSLRLLALWAARRAAFAGLWAHRSWVSGDWTPGASDLDLAASARGLDTAEGRERLRDAQRLYARARRAFPALGELLVAGEDDWARASEAGLPRQRDWPARASLLSGRFPSLPAPRSREAETAGQRLEAAWAYSRLMDACARPGLSEPIARREAAKAAADILRALAPAGSAERGLPRGELLETAARRDAALADRLAELARPGRAHSGACRLAAGLLEALAVAAPDAAPEPRAESSGSPSPHREAVERARFHFGDALQGAVFDSLHRSYVVARDDAPAETLAAALAGWTREAAACARPTPLPVLLTRSAWAAWRGSAYQDFPASLAAEPLLEHGVERAGRAFPGASRYFWGSWRTAPPAGEAAELALEQSAAQLRTVWRHWAAALGESPASDHHLVSRLAAHALLRLRLPAPDFDLDASLSALERAEPALGAALWRAAAGDREALDEAGSRALL